MQFIEKRKWFYIFSLAIIIPGIISMMLQGFNLGIDFRGGSMLLYRMDAGLEAAAVSQAVSELGVVPEVSVQKSGTEFYVRTTELSQEQTQKITDGLIAKYQAAELLSAESVGAIIGGELVKNAFLAVAIALVLMLIYITFRFEWSFGLAAVLALFHDVLIVCGIFSIFQLEVNSAFIAAILTVIGYSINDTIVIFDRVRENLRMKKREVLSALLNKSIMQTMNRSINTVLTVLMPLVTLLLFGGGTIKIFVITLLIGFLFGMYSSICVASPLFYEIKQRG
ncbi:MAG: protein translocase subunit SecF [Syntrophomonadaceae bacterium]|nr:protein translocase subunit SecF [Syntrophomonadaceae bacterium]